MSLSDDTMVTLAPALDGVARIGRDQIVGLEILALDAAHVERVGRLAHELELRDEIVRRLGADAPCTGRRCGCGRWCARCRTRRRGDRRRSPACNLKSMLREAEHGADRRAIGARQRRQRVIGAEDVTRAVDQIDVA